MNQNQSTTGSNVLVEKDYANILLSDLKRVVREYATAATEASCQNVRQMFTDLLNSTLQMQGNLFKVMSDVNMYTQPSDAPQKEITKQIQSSRTCIQKTNQQLQPIYSATSDSQQMQSTMH